MSWLPTSSLLIGLVLTGGLAAGNGANDVSRAAATLLGGGVAPYRRVLGWVLVWTLLGSLASGWLAAAVAARVAAAVAADVGRSPDAVFALIGGALAWVTSATALRLPVATTHAVLGALLGIAWSLGGWEACGRLNLLGSFVLPLLTSPLLALALAYGSRWAASRLPRPESLERLHWASSGLVAFSRGVNDSAKIWALILPLAALEGLSPGTATAFGVGLVAIAMAAGAAGFGRRVTDTFAFGIRRMNAVDGAVANLCTAGIIIAASLLSFPVASSHVVGGAIVGAGLAARRPGFAWATLRDVAAAWVLTLPGAALAAAALLGAGRGAPAAAALVLLAGLVAGAWRLFGARRRLIVFVCNSNTSRSPMAARICDALLASGEGPGARARAISRGLSSVPGTALAPGAAAGLGAIGFAAGPHGARDLDAATARRAAVIYCMTEGQVERVRTLFPAAVGKTRRLLADGDIADPSSGGPEVYAAVATVLRDAVRLRLAAA